MDAPMIFCAAVAALAALTGSRTALALLCSLIVSQFVESRFGLWLIDVAVLSVILRPSMTVADELIAALFVLAWIGLLLDDAARYEVAYAVVAAQFLLTAPVTMIRREAVIVSDFLTDLAAFIRARLFERAAYA